MRKKSFKHFFKFPTEHSAEKTPKDTGTELLTVATGNILGKETPMGGSGLAEKRREAKLAS